MNVDAQPAGGGLSFKKWNMRMGFSVFLGNSEVKYMRLQYKPLIRNFKMLYLVVLFCIQYFILVFGQRFSKMNIVAVAAEKISVIGCDPYGSFLNFFQYAGIR